MNLIKKHVRSIALVCMICLFGASIMQTSIDVNAATLLGASHPEHNTVKLSWSPVAGASGYNIYMGAATDTQLYYITSVNDTKFTCSGLAENTKYNFKVIPYVATIQGNLEGEASNLVVESSNRMGIDVSKWQGNMDWAKLRAESDVNFVMIRIGYSTTDGVFTTNLDEKYVENIQAARANGFKVGVYYYSKAVNTDQARQEASFVINSLQGTVLDYPVAFDIEDSVQKQQSKTTNSLSAITFCETVKAAGYSPMVYCGLNFMQNYLDYNMINQYDIWIARYNSYLGYENPVRMWQYSSKAVLPGITANTVDVNYEYDYKDTIKGSVVFDLSTSNLFYKAAAGDSIEGVSAKTGMNVADILAQNIGMAGNSVLADAQNIQLHAVTLVPASAVAVPTPAPVVAPSIPVGVKASSTSATSIKVTWQPAANADQYHIYRATSKNGAYSLVATTSATSYTNSKLAFNKTYYYKVYAVNTVTAKNSDASAIVSAKTALAKPVISSAKGSKKQVKVTWKKVGSASGYRVYTATKKNGSYKQVKDIKGTSLTINKLSSKKTYYYKVKAYKVVKGKKVFGSVSSVKSAKTK